jgi:hypothetical protein
VRRAILAVLAAAIVLGSGCAPTPEQTRVAISDWRSGRADPDCEIDGESIQWQADYCMMAMQTDDLIAADRCMDIESRTYHGEECARRRYFKQEWCRGVVDNGSLPRTLAECIADPEAGGHTVQGARRD